MDNLKTDLQKMIELSDAARAVMETEAAVGNEPLRRSIKATVKFANFEIRKGMRGVDILRPI